MVILLDQTIGLILAKMEEVATLTSTDVVNFESTALLFCYLKAEKMGIVLQSVSSSNAAATVNF
jgi:hypothetical protein